MLATLHDRRFVISMALLTVMVLSVLLFCPMTVDAGQMQLSHDNHSDMLMADMMSENLEDRSGNSSGNSPEMNMHNCCKPGETLLENDTLCPDCKESEQVLQPHFSDLQPVYMLLYVVLLQTLDPALEGHVWQTRNELDILSSQPDIYLAKVSFLE